MLPLGKKSLSDIRSIPQPVDQLNDLVALMEYTLKAIPECAAGDNETAYQIVNRCAEIFPAHVYRRIQSALAIRNRLFHTTDRPPTEKSVAFAVRQLLRSIELDLLPRLPPDVATWVLGDGRSSRPSSPARKQLRYGQTAARRENTSIKWYLARAFLLPLMVAIVFWWLALRPRNERGATRPAPKTQRQKNEAGNGVPPELRPTYPESEFTRY